MSMSSALTSKNCFLLKNQECKVRKVIVDNDCMTFPYKIKVDVVKNISVESLI